MIDGANILSAMLNLQERVYELTAENRLEITLPETAFDQLALHLHDTYAVKVQRLGASEAQLVFRDITIWRHQSLSTLR